MEANRYGSVTLNLDTALTGKAVVRAFSGNVSASYFVATATQVQYADLAEKYSRCRRFTFRGDSCIYLVVTKKLQHVR